MIITTTHSVEGRQIAAYLDVVSAESVQGINVVRDMFAGMRDFFGGRSQTLEKALREARAQATDELTRIRDAREIVLAHRDASIPFSYVDGKGQVMGYSIDLCQRLVEAVRAHLAALHRAGASGGARRARTTPSRP